MPKRLSDPWRIVWLAATSQIVVAVLLLCVALSLMLTTWIPQAPSPEVDYARWFSQVQARFGDATPAMRGLGLLNVTGSFGFRLLLALLSGCLVLQLVEGAAGLWQGDEPLDPDGKWEQLSEGDLDELLDDLRDENYRTIDGSSCYQVDRWPLADLSLLVVRTGALVVLGGLLLSQLWGWQVDGLVLQRGQQLSLPASNHWVGLNDEGSELMHSAGAVGFIEGEGPGVAVRAVDEEGRTLRLQLTAEAEPSTELLVALTEDRYFAVPEADLIVRLRPLSETPYASLEVQAYRSPPGEIVAELVTGDGGETDLTMEGVTLELAPAPYVEATVSRNPGRWTTAVGLVLLISGLLTNLMRPGCRFWVRESEGRIEAAGRVPLSVFAEEEGA